ncbi:ParE toxin of type II toxin-antitoxin system, parDE [Neorhodopirellula lusitana]|uniref:ParE toxin of type II toxin-antitoxin system, parDE n=1 Tax=Neorhodopirellula lusitana TaxID=445327 RepID=A0ABY1Q7F1_9BACT|nr:type II toxin-antitoxin system RelE/ParE family toxin [Neorhodopirellula lusitana]SMP61222.1 ParE toxin of type II toxin-antitoxin system, parDE [Neorhodopirellula lusitana]
MTNSGDVLMAKVRRYHPLVADDLSAATAYYDEISADLGNRFRSSVRASLQDVAHRPESFGRLENEMRAATLDRFPYVMIYESRDNHVAILGVYHAASEQNGWFDRSL